MLFAQYPVPLSLHTQKTLAVKNENLLSLIPLTFSLQFLYDTIFGVWKSYLMALGNSHSFKKIPLFIVIKYIFLKRGGDEIKVHKL